MEQNIIEEKNNKLNLEIREILTIIDLIDEKKRKYEDYVPNTINEFEFLDQQISLINEAKERLINIFKG